MSPRRPCRGQPHDDPGSEPRPDEVSGERLERLIASVREVARRKNAALVGSTHEVLVEKPARRGDLLQTRTRANKVVLVDASADLLGTYQEVRLTGTTGATFTGVCVPTTRTLSIVG